MKSIKLGDKSITDHVFSQDASLLIVARGAEAELLYGSGKQYEHGCTLKAHDKRITAVDISCNGQIVTCSEDRNAYVWDVQADGSWRQTLVLLRLNRAATSVKWSPDGKKFAVGSAARIIAVCHYEEENDWWISRHIKKPLRSTVHSVAWHPNSVLLAAGSTDGHAYVFSGYIKTIDERPEPSVWGDRLPFQTLCGDFSDQTLARVNDVSFSPSGDALAWAANDGSLLVVYPSGPEQPHRAFVSVKTDMMPFCRLVWTREDQIVAAGYDCHPVVFDANGTNWAFSRSIDDPSKAVRGDAEEQSALSMFRQLDLKGKEFTDSSLKTVHQNTITTLRLFGPNQISTSGDGQVVIFDV